MSSFGSVYVGVNQNSEHRRENDHYPTPPVATFALLQSVDVPDTIWEPAAGRGWMSRELQRCGKRVYSSDLFEYNDPLVNVDYGLDFLITKKPADVRSIVTNPPYQKRLPERFIEHAMSLDIDLLAIVVRIQFLEGKNRCEMFNRYKPSSILMMSRRLKCFEEDLPHNQLGGMIPYIWVIWDRRTTSDVTSFHFIDMHDMLDKWENSIKPRSTLF